MIAFKNLKRKIIGIGKQASGGFENLSFPGLFSTKIGKKLGRQLSNLSMFVFASCFLTFPAGELQNAWLAIVRTNDIVKFRPLAKSEKEYEKFEQLISCLELFSEDEDSSDFSHLFGRRELRRFLALLSLSAFSYLEVFGQKLCDYIKEHPSICSKVLSHLQQNDVRDKCGTHVLTMSQVKNLGIRKKLSILAESLGADKACDKHLGDGEFSRYRNLFDYFIRLRGKMAHGNPEPSLSKFDHEFFQSARKDVKKAFTTFADDMTEVPEPLRNHVEIIQSWFRKIASTLAVIYAVPKIIVTYTSIIDSVIAHHVVTSSS